MKPENALNERDALRSQIKFHRLVSLVLACSLSISLLILGYVVFRETTFIVPPEVRRPYEIGASQANKEYLADMAGYVLGMVLTVTPETVDYNNKVILKMAHPDGYGQLKTALDAAALRIRHERVATVWVPRKEDVFERDMQVRVNGMLKTYIADKLTSEREKNYLIQFVVTSSGRLYVSKIEEIVKSGRAERSADQS